MGRPQAHGNTPQLFIKGTGNGPVTCLERVRLQVTL
jgi:hypothetical protein